LQYPHDPHENDAMDPRATELLGRPIVGQLGFHGLDGYPHVLPVWFEYREGELLIASPAAAYKGRALAKDGRAALAVSTVERPYHIVSVVGDAAVEPLPEPERIEFVTAIATRYLGPDDGRRYVQAWIKGGHPGVGELIRLRPRKIHFYVS
jgi:nitroimidazol reductase NimA-like FMN-containing flavoprotein (pyridoxamine 5'-phosphate oxidase superfamily)